VSSQVQVMLADGQPQVLTVLVFVGWVPSFLAGWLTISLRRKGSEVGFTDLRERS
jgi:hypothetical protein